MREMEISMDFKATRNLFTTGSTEKRRLPSASATPNDMGMVSGFACADNFLSAEKVGKQAYPQLY